MRKIARIGRVTTLYMAALLLVGFYPIVTVAAEDIPSVQTVAPDEAAASQKQPTYTYDKATGSWSTDAWVYDATTRRYKPAEVPLPPVDTKAPVTVVVPTADGNKAGVGDAVKPTAEVDTATNAKADTAVNATANTGDALVTKNTNAGAATSGDATSTATIVNTVNSQVSAGDNKKAADFVANITGDVTGDIVLQPMLLKAMLEAGAPTTTTSTTNTGLTNDINLKATSGAATVSANTKAGDATTGSANTVADVVNIINSMIAANQSFTGTVNIYGNLNGDILIAPDFIPQLLASNGIASTNTPQKVSATDTQSIVNNVSLAAASGQAAVLGNTKAGSATTGESKTNLVIFNLSGHDIVATNSLLVFVNVLGTWVGVIVDAPAGTTAAAIGTGVTSSKTAAPDLVVKADTTNRITNNIQLQSQSGDASVTGNTVAGNATSGNATASANIANISNSQIGLSGWFGILFINVFGSWHGSFGIDTPFGNTPVRVAAGPDAQPVAFVPHGSLGAPIRLAPQPITVITPTADGTYHPATIQPTARTASVTNASSPLRVKVPVAAHHQAVAVADYRLPIALGSLFIMGLSIAGWRRLSS